MMEQARKINKLERDILKIIARGHPSRMVNFKTTSYKAAVNALDWDELKKESGLPFEDFCNCMAHLLQKNLIENGTQYPGIIARILGKEERVYSWVTELGRKFMTESHHRDEISKNLVSPSSTDITKDDVIEACRIFANSLEKNPYVEQKEVDWANPLIDEDVKKEIEIAGLELEEMWELQEKKFGKRHASSTKEQLAVRDPVVKKATVRIIRAQDELLKRRGFHPSEKPESWETHYNNGDVGLEPASWEKI